MWTNIFTSARRAASAVGPRTRRPQPASLPPGSTGRRSRRNERLALSTIRRLGGASKADLAKITGLSPQLLCGVGLGIENYLYFHIGAFVGDGLVLGGQVHQGKHGNAAALASMPVPGGDGQQSLLHRASLYVLEAALGGKDDAVIRQAWLESCVEALAFATIGANSLLDLDAVVVSGALDEATLETLAGLLKARLQADAPVDFFQPDLLVGRIREAAPAVGAGLLPLYASYTPNLGSLLKGAGD